MDIRSFELSDRDQIVSLWNAVFPGATGHNDPGDSIDRKVTVGDGLFFVAVDGDAVIGTAMAGYDGHRGWLYSIAVSPDWRRRGIGTQLVRHTVNVLFGRGCPKINLQILAENAEVVSFYESLGFKVEERISMGKLGPEYRRE